jgi:DNA-binding XRE family transcriptional regulator
MIMAKKTNWTPEQNKELLQAVIAHLQDGKTITMACEAIANKLHYSLGGVVTHFHRHIRKHHLDELRNLKVDKPKKPKPNPNRRTKDINYSPKTDEKIMTAALGVLRSGGSVGEAIRSAGVAIGRPENGVKRRWYKVLLNRYTIEIQEATEEGKSLKKFPRTKLKEARETLGLFGGDIADAIGVHKVHYNAMERGRDTLADKYKGKIIERLREEQEKLLTGDCRNKRAIFELVIDESIFDK